MGELSKAFPFKTGLDVFISAIFFSLGATTAASCPRAAKGRDPVSSLDGSGGRLGEFILR
jgi:hypothetical protein